MSSVILAARISLALVILSPGGVCAQQANSQIPVPVSSLSAGHVFQVLIGLLIVLAAIGAAAWLLKRFPLGKQAMGGVVKVIGGVALGPRERLVLVEIGDTWLLLGVAPGQVSSLHNMPKPADVPNIEALPEPAFASWLTQALHKQAGK